MMSGKGNLTALACLLFVCSSLFGDKILLNNGYELFVDIIKSDDQRVVVDMGFDIVVIPKEEILEISQPSQNASNDNDDIQDQKSWEIYRSKTMSPTSIQENVSKFSEAVVMVTSPGGQGSGFVISDDGYLITNYHVIARETNLKIVIFRKNNTGYEQKTFKNVKIIAINPYLDLALLKIDAPEESFKISYLGNMNDLEVGQRVFAIGNPLGLTRSVSQGIVSTNNRNFEGQLYIQTTADINPGNSGGPLFNLNGQVVGVTSMGYIYLGGLNFAIPIDVVKRFIDNRDAFAYDEENPNSGFRYLQPSHRKSSESAPKGKLPF